MIDILMSTYNGEEFIEAQIDSILSQDLNEFRLLVRDDGSKDGTAEILRSYSLADSRVVIVKDEKGNIGPARSFLSLLKCSTSDFFMFADQDDVWLPGKISSSLRRIEELVTAGGSTRPTVFFTDLVVCDKELKTISDSFWQYQSLDPEISHDWRRLLVQNVVTGCTMIGNAAARQAALPFALEEMFHDHWVAVNVARSGIVDYDKTATVLYRQHSENAEGASAFDLGYVLKRLRQPFRRYNFYRKAGHFFDVSPNRLILSKILEGLKRLI